jgi:HrpA-like RNA helicase
VVESGANIPWLDAGVTCGTAKEIVVRPETGATFLKLIELPRWRLDQQEGRVKRFRDGIFVLCSPLAYEQREAETTPEIRRLPLTELVMHCASFGLRAEELRFDYAPETARIVEAETKLQRLGLIDADCRLTKAGKWVSGMPVGPETGAMLWHAKNTGVLGAALPLAAVIEVDGIRKDFREPHGCDNTSDWLDALKAFQAVYSEKESWKRKELMEKFNVSYKRFEAAKEMLHDLRRRFNGDVSSTLVATDGQLKLCLVAGFITSLFQGGYSLTQLAGDRYSSYNIGNGSAASYLRGGYALGQLRTIQPKDRRKSAFTVVEKVTDVSLDDIVAVAKVRPSLITTETERVKVGYFAFQTVITRKLFGAYELKVEKADSPLTKNEEAEKAAFEATRATLRQQLDALNPLREELGLERIRHEDEAFRFGYYGSRYAYTAEDVARAEDDNVKALEARRAELEAHKATQQADAERVAREASEAQAQAEAEAVLSARYAEAASLGLPSNVEIWRRRGGATNAGDGWVVQPNGMPRERDEMMCPRPRYPDEGTQVWKQILPGELVLQWSKAMTAAEHMFEVIYRPETLTEAQLRTVALLQEELAADWEGRRGLASGNLSPDIGEGWGLLPKEPPPPEPVVTPVAAGGGRATPDALAALRTHFVRK